MIIQQSALIHIAANSKDQFVSQLLTNPREIELKRSFILSQYWLFFIPFFSTNELTFGNEERSNVLLIILSLQLTIDSFQNNIIIMNYKNKQLMSGFNYKIQSEQARNLYKSVCIPSQGSAERDRFEPQPYPCLLPVTIINSLLD